MAGTEERAMPSDQAHAGPGGRPVPPDRPALDQLFDGDGLYVLRSAVAAHAAELGLSDQGVADLVLLAHELATNAVRHGGATPAEPGRLRLWTADGVVVCQVHDAGPGRDDLDGVGHTPVEATASSGRGLWIVRRLATRLDITTGPAGTTITATMPASTVD
jgi:anti-sigma regulatory factor (Ser/Thr protein kinase)